MIGYVVSSVAAAAVTFFAYATFVMKLEYKDYFFALIGVKIKFYEKKSVNSNKNVVDLWYGAYEKNKNKVAIKFVDTNTSYTFQQIEEMSNRIAHYCVKQGIKAGDTATLFMENRPEYFFIWLGIAKAGGRTALINYNLKHKALVHSITVSNSKIIFFGSELTESLKEIQDDIAKMNCVYVHEGGPSDLGTSLENELSSQPTVPLINPRANGVRFKDPLLYVYTSGTTGLPKAAIVTHHRIFIASYAFTRLYSITGNDIVYTPLPLYHSAGGIIGLGMLFQRGVTVILRKKFSASKFISDIRENDCTITQYIGELCRYVIATPEKADDKTNKLRLAIGNGMRPDVWKTFQTRFNVKQIGEFYAATEGAAPLFNTTNKFGAIGFLSPLVQSFIPVKLVKINQDTEELVRNSKGFCIPCGINEPGEFIAKIYQVKDVSNFSGYTNEEASKKKIAKDVFTKGDQWFRSGDLMKMDRNGFVFFVDRLGDTFRWKGENCSTAEISDILGIFLNGKEANVYGVSIPGKDGRAGMAAVSGLSPDTFDFDGLFKYMLEQLPSYARPLFIRFTPEMDITGTFKHRKVELRDQGFDPSKVKGDPVYFLNGDKHILVDEKVYQDICSGVYKI